MAGSRRDLLRMGVVLGAAALVIARPWNRLGGPDLSFEDMPDLAPMRSLAARGEASGGSVADAVFAGLPGRARSEDARAAEAAARERFRADPCGAFGLDWPEGAPLPVTYFTDIRCPSCRVLEGRLGAIADDGDPAIDVITREFPVFGARSEAAAHAILSAGMQGEAETMRAHLRTRPAPAEAAAAQRLAGRLGLDTAAFARAWNSQEVTRRLAEDRALARLIGLPGTPGLVVGRTVVIGTQSRDVLRALVRREAREGSPAACRG